MKTKTKIVWLVNPYGPVPSEPWRIYTYALFLSYLGRQGYKAIWITSSFSHHYKRQREKASESLGRRQKIFFLNGNGYPHNLSPKRYLRDLHFSIKLYLIFLTRRTSSRPDLVIYTDNPFCLVGGGPAIAKASKSTKVVLHQMDQWHQLYSDYVYTKTNQYLTPFLKIFFNILNKIRVKRLAYLDGSTALSQVYLEELHKSQPILAYKPSCVIYNCSINFSTYKRHNKPSSKLRLIYAGSIGPNYDIDTLINAARSMPELVEVEIVTTSLSRLSNISIPSNVRISESLTKKELTKLYLESDVGVMPYMSWSNVQMPDKFYDYIHHGLAIVNSLSGEVSQFISSSGCGLNYKAECFTSLKDVLYDLAIHQNLLIKCQNASLSLAKILSEETQLHRLGELLKELCI